jgi:hypothetical protein
LPADTQTPDDDTTMQNPHVPQETFENADLLHALCEEIEIAWGAHRDATVVDRLAAGHPGLAEALYEFFALLIQAELDLDQPDEELAKHDARAKQRLEAGGYAEAAEIGRLAGTPGVPTDREVPVPRADVGPHMPGSAPGVQRNVATGNSPKNVTPAADESAAGVPAAGSGPRRERTKSTSPAGRRSEARNFLGLLIEALHEPPESIAAGLGITASFLVSVDDLQDRLPARAREELARRGSSYSGLRREQLSECLGDSLPMAASRGTRYDRQLTYEDVVRRSKFSPTDEDFWLSLED